MSSPESRPVPEDVVSQADQNETKKKIVIVENEDALETEARDAAEANLNASQKELKGVGGYIKKIWKHNLFHEYYRQKEIIKIKKQITETKNLYAGETSDKTAHEQTMKALIDRFSEESDETLHKTRDKNGNVVEETRRTLGTEGLDGAGKTEIRRIITDYAVGTISEDEFKEERNRILNAITRMGRPAIDSEVRHTDNLLEIARQVKLAVEHGKSLDDLDLDFEVVVGKAKSGVRTQEQFNAVDRIVDRIQGTAIGRLVNETTLTTGVALAYSLTAGLSKRVATSKIAGWGTFGATAVVGAGVAAARESKRLEEERRQHFRDMAKGKQFDPDNAPRRKEMEEYRYQTEAAGTMTKELNDRLENENITQDEALVIIGQLANIEARITMSDLNNIDLISYSSTGQIEKERLDMDITRAKAKVRLRNMVNAGTLDLQGQTLDNFLDQAVVARIDGLNQGDEGIERKNQMFRKMKTRQVGKAAVKAFFTGLVVGAAFQEGVALIRENQQGIVEGFTKGAKGLRDIVSVTPLEKLRVLMSGEDYRFGLSNNEVDLGSGIAKLPDGVELLADPSGPERFDLVHNGVVIVENLDFENGKLNQQSIDALAEKGIGITFETKTVNSPLPGHPPIPGSGGHGSSTMNARDYVNQNPNMFDKIHRPLWYDNNTPAPVFEKGELRLDWGDVGVGDGIDANGNYVFNISRMTPDGSYHKNFSVDAQQALKDGKLRLLLSLSRDTQTQVVEIPFDVHGNAIIDPNSEVGKVFFETVNGKAVFTGKFAEVAEIAGVDKNNEERFNILATHEGEDRPGFAESGTEGIPGKDGMVTKEVAINIFDFPDYYTEPPPIIPLVARRPLEKTLAAGAPPEKEPLPIYGYNEKLKSRFSSINSYRLNREQRQMMINTNIGLRRKYSHVFQRLENLRSYNDLRGRDKTELESQLQAYNKRYFANNVEKHLSLEQFVALEIDRTERQFENMLLEEAQVGDKPYPREFYEKSPLVKGLKEAEEVVMIFDYPIGDAVVTGTLPMAVDKYLRLNGMEKPMTVVTRHPDLFKCLESQYPGLKIVNQKDMPTAFRDKKKRFIFNAHKSFEQYEVFGMTEDESKDPSKVMSLDWSSWDKEEAPTTRRGFTKKFDPIPARILRNMEVMTGQKLFEDINAMDHFLEKEPNFEQKSTELKRKYGIKDGEKIIVVSAGSSVIPKEYSPENWKKVLKQITEDHPDVHVLFINDINPDKQKLYGEMVDNIPGNITRVDSNFSDMNALMSMAELTITPDTGLGHYASALGTPNVMFVLGDPVRWSTAKTRRLIHKKGYESYAKNSGTYERAWQQPKGYFVEDEGEMVGASDIPPEEIIKKVTEELARPKSSGATRRTRTVPTTIRTAPIPRTTPTTTRTTPTSRISRVRNILPRRSRTTPTPSDTNRRVEL